MLIIIILLVAQLVEHGIVVEKNKIPVAAGSNPVQQIKGFIPIVFRYTMKHWLP